MKKFLKNQGFTLAEILITMGLLSVVSYGLMKMLSDTTKSQKTLEAKDSMSQLQREIITFLANEQNCSASLAGKHNGDPVSILYKATNSGIVPKFYSNVEIGKSQISIESMAIQNVELIGDGSHSKANLKIMMKKLSKDALGGKLIPFDIKLSANLCTTSLLIKPTLADIQTACAGGSKKITGGLKAWGGQFWAACQDCSGAINSATANISSCQSMGGGGAGVDTNDVSKLSCLNMGGTFNDSTNTCMFGNQTLDDHIKALIDIGINDFKATLPSCIISTDACSGLYANKMGEYQLKENYINNYTLYSVSCVGQYSRRDTTLCKANYSSYSTTTSGSCSSSARSYIASCSTGSHDAINGCTGCGGGCFTWSGDSCNTSSSPQSETLQKDVKVNKCCK